MSSYEPELGQLAFGQPFKEHTVSEHVEAVLMLLDRAMERVWFNTHPHNDPYISPFGNTGARYSETPVFTVHAYDWCGEDQAWNFKWGEVEISWYKYLGRGMSANMEISPDLSAKMLGACLVAIRTLERDDAASLPETPQAI